VIRPLKAALLLACVFATGGCGLLMVPQCRALPHANLRTIVITDFDTGEPVTDADVKCYFYSDSKWWYPPIWEYSSEMPEYPGHNTWPDPLEATHASDGVYELPVAYKVRWIQVWFPAPSPLGYFFYHGYDADIEIISESHGRVSIPNVMGKTRGRWDDPSCEKDESRLPRAIIRNRRLELALPKVE
jgi:hypothetical protein